MLINTIIAMTRCTVEIAEYFATRVEVTFLNFPAIIALYRVLRKTSQNLSGPGNIIFDVTVKSDPLVRNKALRQVAVKISFFTKLSEIIKVTDTCF